MKKKYFEDLADYILRHGIPAKSFDLSQNVSRKDIIIRLETDEKYRKKTRGKKKKYGESEMLFWKEIIPTARSDYTN